MEESAFTTQQSTFLHLFASYICSREGKFCFDDATKDLEQLAGSCWLTEAGIIIVAAHTLLNLCERYIVSPNLPISKSLEKLETMSYTLTFSNLIGEFVTDKELLGAQDPYVVFEAGGRKSQTKVNFKDMPTSFADTLSMQIFLATPHTRCHL